MMGFFTGVRRFCIALALVLIAPILITTSADAQNVAIPGNHLPEATALTARAAASRPLDLRIILALHDQAALDRLLAAQHDPASPQFHHWLTPDEFNARFAPRQADFEAVVSWLKSEGITISTADRAGRYIAFTLPAAEAERLFSVTIAASADGKSYANLTDPSIPARFAGVIAHVDGLNNLRRAHPMIKRLGPQLIPDSAQAGSPWYLYDNGLGFGPADVYTFYDDNGALDGSGQCIGLVEDSDWIDSAVALFDNQFGLPAASITRVLAGGSDPGINADEGESLIDIEWAHAIAPAAGLKVYISPKRGNIVDSISRAIADNSCAVISISFGYCGASPTFYSKTLNNFFEQAAAQGISVFVASGDNGAENCPTGTQNVSEMAADPNVTAVGGTMFTPNYDSDGNDVGFVPEQVWNVAPKPPYSGGASGGGISAVFGKPGFQNGLTPNDNHRDVPDVAMLAGPPGVYLGDDDGGPVLDCCWGGTSLTAPLFAGILTLINQNQGERIGNADYGLYQLGPVENSSSVGLREVISGDNSFNGVPGYSAGPGYNRATGWGTADIADLITAWKTDVKPAPITVTLAASPKKLNLGKAVFGATGATTKAQIVTITNPGGAHGMPVAFTSIAADQPTTFGVSTAITLGCGSTLAAGHSCKISVTYTPSAQALQTGNLVILDNTVAGRTTVPLSGTGIAGAITFKPDKLAFGKQTSGTTSSSPRLITVTNPNRVDLMITSITVNGDFLKASDGCTGVLKSKSDGGPNACQVGVAFSPTTTGPLKGALVFTDDAGKGSQTINLSGTGK